MAKKKRYCKETDRLMAGIVKYLESVYNGLPQEFETSLVLLSDAIDYYLVSREKMKDDGLMFECEGKRYLSPLYPVLCRQQDIIMKILGQFGLTSLSRSKIKLSEKTISAEDFLASLTTNTDD